MDVGPDSTVPRAAPSRRSWKVWRLKTRVPASAGCRQVTHCRPWRWTCGSPRLRWMLKVSGSLMVAIEDISHEKRVDVLQRTFFHDVLNTAGLYPGVRRLSGRGDDSGSKRLWPIASTHEPID